MLDQTFASFFIRFLNHDKMNVFMVLELHLTGGFKSQNNAFIVTE